MFYVIYQRTKYKMSDATMPHKKLKVVNYYGNCGILYFFHYTKKH